MNNTQSKGILKTVLGVLAALAVITAAVAFLAPNPAKAASGTVTKKLKAGDSDSSAKLTKEANIATYEIDVPKDDRELELEFSAGSVSDRVIVSFWYKSDSNSPIYREDYYPEDGKISGHLYFSVLESGKYYLSFSGEGKSSTTGKITLKTNLYSFDLSDKEDNNTYKKAQDLPLDGQVRIYFLCSLKEYGLAEDTVDWFKFKIGSEGFFLYAKNEDNVFASVSMELYDGNGSKPELKFTYSLSEPQEKVLRTLPAGTYYLKINWGDSTAKKGFFYNQTIYQLAVAPYKELKSFELSKSKLTLTTKGSSSKATLTPVLNPEDAIPRTVSWKSSNSKVATVEKGVVKGKKKGTAVITCTITDVAGNTKSSTCKVTVKKK